MSRFYLTLVFSAASLAGFGMILYGILAGPRQNREANREAVTLGFFGSAEEPVGGILDLDMGHEGLKHREKEAFDPEKHKPEPIESTKKNSPGI